MPEPDLAISEAIEALDSADRGHYLWIEESRRVRNELFGVDPIMWREEKFNVRMLPQKQRVCNSQVWNVNADDCNKPPRTQR